MNLLDHFVLKHVQVTLLHAEVIQLSPEPGPQEAKVELNLTPRPMKMPAGKGDAEKGEASMTDAPNWLPVYQVSARLSCQGGSKGMAGPRFTAQAGIETIYEQVNGDPVDLAVFTTHHASLTRQIYPLLQNELRILLTRLGLEQIHLPFDLAARVHDVPGQTIQVSEVLH